MTCHDDHEAQRQQEPRHDAAMNSRPTDTSAIEAIDQHPDARGDDGAMMPDAAVTAAKRLAVALRTITGTRVLESMAASAFPDPDMPPMNTLFSTLTCASPPTPMSY